MKEYFGMMATLAKLKMKQLFTDEKGEVNIVMMVVLIGIGVLLAVVFKNQIIDLLNTLFGSLKDSANGAILGE